MKVEIIDDHMTVICDSTKELINHITAAHALEKLTNSSKLTDKRFLCDGIIFTLWGEIGSGEIRMSRQGRWEDATKYFSIAVLEECLGDLSPAALLQVSM